MFININNCSTFDEIVNYINKNSQSWFVPLIYCAPSVGYTFNIKKVLLVPQEYCGNYCFCLGTASGSPDRRYIHFTSYGLLLNAVAEGWLYASDLNPKYQWTGWKKR